jgi:capsular polysaccharide biosynthesis protein
MSALSGEEREVVLRSLTTTAFERPALFARRLAELAGVESPLRPQEVEGFAEAIGQRLGVDSFFQTVTLSEAAEAGVNGYFGAGAPRLPREELAMGPEVPWGARTNPQPIVSSPIELWSLSGARVVQWGEQVVVLDKQLRLVKEVSSRWWPVMAMSMWFRDLSLQRSPQLLQGEAFLAVSDDAIFNYCHWLSNIMTRMWLAPRQSLFLLPNAAPMFQVESLALMKWHERVRRLPDTGPVLVDELVVSTNLGQGLRHPAHKGAPWALTAFDEISSRCFREYGGIRTPKRILVSRQDAQRRQLVHEAALGDALADAGFQVIAFSRISFVEQVATFAGAELVVGLHGAGLSGACFLSDRSTLVEIHGHDYGTPAFRVLSTARGAKYVSATGQTVVEGEGNRGNVTVSISDVAQLVRKQL